MYYVYVHYRADNKVPFYVGKGRKSRITCFSKRSVYWTRIYNKYGCIPKIIAEFDDEQQAFNFEKYLIKKFRDNQITLCNLTDGGEGASGIKLSEEAKAKISERMKNNKNGSYQKGKPKLNQRGAKSYSFKGYVLATNIETKETIILDGKISSQLHGFDYRKVSACVNNKRKTHKGYTFQRIGDLNGNSCL